MERPLVIAARKGVAIDCCPKCRGVWLDRGELDKIIDRTAQAVPAYPRDAVQERPYKRIRESFLGELFDF